MKSAVFWDVAPCSFCVNRRFKRNVSTTAHAGSSLAKFSTRKMEAIRSSETSVHTKTTRRHIPGNGILQIRNSQATTEDDSAPSKMAARILVYKHTFKRFKTHPRIVGIYVETHDAKLKKSIFY
jgi:hypothetical protein